VGDEVSPCVKFSKFNKRISIITLKSISIDIILRFLGLFLYNKQFTKKQKINYYVDSIELLNTNNYLKKKKILCLCSFKGVFKQDLLEHIFFNLGISGLKITSNIIFRSVNDINNSMFDLIHLSGYGTKIKEFLLFEDVE